MGYSIFNPYRAVEGKFPWGAPNAFSKGARLKLPFLGGQVKFSRGVMMVRLIGVSFPEGSYLENCFFTGDF